MAPNIGLDSDTRSKVAEALGSLLADTYLLAAKTHGFHWNVTGPSFPMLHDLFGRQYEALFEAADELAERIRALGRPAPYGLKPLAKLSAIEDEKEALDAKGMLKALLRDHEALSLAARKLQGLAAELGDEVTADMLIERMGAHEKEAWMLRVQLE